MWYVQTYPSQVLRRLDFPTAKYGKKDTSYMRGAAVALLTMAMLSKTRTQADRFVRLAHAAPHRIMWQ